MKKTIRGVALTLITLAACTSIDPMAHYFGNTLYVIPGGGEAHYVYYNSDGTFEVVFPEMRYGGTYDIEGKQVCLTAIRPGDARKSTNCHSFDASRQAGESWTESAAEGVTRFRLDAGRAKSIG